MSTLVRPLVALVAALCLAACVGDASDDASNDGDTATATQAMCASAGLRMCTPLSDTGDTQIACCK